MRFILVHGGTMGAWCFKDLIDELSRLGHTALAPDLPGHGVRAAEVSTLDGYRETVAQLMEPGDVLVGHSMGGFVTTLAADRAPEKVRHLIYIAAGIHQEGLTMQESLLRARQDSGAEGADFSAYVEFAPTARASPSRMPPWLAPAYARTAARSRQNGRSHTCPQLMRPQREPIRTPRFWQAPFPRATSFVRRTAPCRGPCAICSQDSSA